MNDLDQVVRAGSALAALVEFNRATQHKQYHDAGLAGQCGKPTCIAARIALSQWKEATTP